MPYVIKLCRSTERERNTIIIHRWWWNEVRSEFSFTYIQILISLFPSRGLIAINALRRIEDLVGEPIHTMFDYMCGVSTGAVITAMLGRLTGLIVKRKRNIFDR